MKQLLWLPLILTVGCAGGGSAHYDESDNHRTISADLGTTFYLSFPESMKEKAVFPPSVLELVSDKIDEATHRRTLEFTVRGMKEVSISVGKDYSLTLRVTSSSDRPGMHLNH